MVALTGWRTPRPSIRAVMCTDAVADLLCVHTHTRVMQQGIRRKNTEG